MAAVRSGAPAHWNPGIELAGNDTGKALNLRAYYEATKVRIVFVQAVWREC